MASARTVDALTALRRAPWRLPLSSWPYRTTLYLVLTVLWCLVFTGPVVLAFLLLPVWGVGWGRLQRPPAR